jgi:long-chain fatty acid transport protein
MHRHSPLALALGGLLLPFAAQATNGYFAHGYGVVNQGLAGAGTALSQDSLAAATNPAGMAFVGDRMDAAVELFSPTREYRISGSAAPGSFGLAEGRIRSGRSLFAIPNVAFNRTLSDNQTLGVTLFANGGINTDYPGENGGTFGAGRAGVNLEQLFLTTTWTWQPVSGQAIGIAPVLAYQRFSARGVGSFAGFSQAPEAVSDNGTDSAFGVGIHLGWQGNLGEDWRAGVAWRSRLRMGRFDRYRGLFADSGDFDIPATFSAGLAWRPAADHWLLLDVQHTRYSSIPAVGNPLLPNLFAAPLGDAQGPGFGWRDMTTVKLGWQWQSSERQTWRLGASYGRQPIPDSEVLFNIIAPGVQEWHVSGGFTRALGVRLSVSAVVFHSPKKTVSGVNPLGPGQSIELGMYQWGLAAGFGLRF